MTTIARLAIRSMSFLFVCVSLSSSALAQREPTGSLRNHSDTANAVAKAAVSRTLLSTAGAVGGAFAGGYIGYHVLSHDCGGCDDPGLAAVLIGALVGTATGAALGAAAPEVGSVCSFGERFSRTLAGAVVGSATLALAVRGGGILIAVPTGAVGGSLASLGHCWRAR
jgi:hypothetical protein